MKKRLIAVGDIHGHYYPLIRLLDIIHPTPQDKFVFIGDYIDRGPHSKQVIEYLIDFEKKYDAVFLRGNHEDMLLAYICEDPEAQYGDSYPINGSDKTAYSYTGRENSLPELKQYLPISHLNFIKRTLLYYEMDKYIFVHAGVYPNVPMKLQKRENLLWIREPFFRYPTGLNKIVVFGHTVMKDVIISKSRIAIDTGAGCNLSLSAIELNSKKKYSINIEDKLD